LPLLKPPVWTWEVPAYVFVGGAAGAAACIGLASRLAGDDARVTRGAQWIAAIGAAISGPLLIADLGRPERFLAMLRVFKPRSPMSVGAWLLAVFGGASGGAIVFRGRFRDAMSALSAATGLGMATYTGVLIGATAIPVWSSHAYLLPAHFGASGLASAVSALELLGHRSRALNNLGRAAAAFESAVGLYLEHQRREEAADLLRGQTGLTTRIGGVFSGPIPLLLRLLWGRSRRARQAAAVSTLLGSYLTRLAWIEAGKRCAERSPVDAVRGRNSIGE
jgi:formate-dependent nitrite reductase membrane component NrfD